MKTEQLLELIRELFDVSEYDEDDRCIVLHSRRNGVLRFERFAQRVLEAAPAVEPAKAEPAAWCSILENGNIRLWHTKESVAAGYARADGHTLTPLYLHPATLDAETKRLALGICEHVLSHTHPWAFIDEAKKLKKLLGAE